MSILPREVLARIFLALADVLILVQLDCFALDEDQSPLRLISRPDCRRLALECSAETIVALYRAGHASVADQIILLNIELRRHARLVDAHDRIVSAAIEHGTHNRLIMTMLRAGFIPNGALNAAARALRFDTVRALFHNDYSGECYMTHTVRIAAIEHDHVQTVRWIFMRCKDFMKTYAFGGADLFIWIDDAIKNDAVQTFAYLHDNHMKACSRNFVTQAVKAKSIDILNWLVRNCKAIRTESLELAIKRQTKEFKTRVRRPHEPYDYRVIELLTSNCNVLVTNDNLRYCSHRPWLNHYDDLHGVLEMKYPEPSLSDWSGTESEDWDW